MSVTTDKCESFKSSLIKIHPLQLQDLQGFGYAPARVYANLNLKEQINDITSIFH